MMKRFSKEESSWMLYDWANSAYSVIIMTAVFPLFFKAAAAENGVSAADSTAYLGYTIAAATFILAMLGPVLGTIADYKGCKKRFFAFFLLIGVAGTAALALIPGESWMLLLICYTISTIGFAGSNVFYDAFLVDVAEKERMNMVSARGFGLGYIGSTIPFLLSIAVILSAQAEVIPLSAQAAGRIAFLITAAWWGLFSIPLLLRVRQRYYIEREPRLVLSSFIRLAGTLALFLFLLAYFFYIDGVGTIITMSTSYGADLGISAANLLIVLFVTQVVAAPFSILYGRLAERFKGKTMLYAGIGVYMIVCTYAYFMDSAFDFWVLAMLVATSQGGIQALSRSYFAKLVPKQNANEFFGFYNIFGKFASIIGPLLIAVTAQLTGNSSAAVFSLILLFVIGIAILAFVPEETV
ncbi:MFS transporter [Bacillus velezensis]|uniref:MFS transporter n=1 Tax=Bacillus velezensis TaxID=492670 RepID=UPI001583D5F0|nr:MFS transporter [Bacillus velezensis]MCG1015705.1 MFS transporter [Bacillus velezensis]MCR6607239.1 MFS transporter [Bacillus velezensis]WFP05413.1 MFS transporter [Bacillus velezensis]